jgi:hypothetical protein
MNADLAGIRSPDSKLAREIMEVVRDTELPLLFKINIHCRLLAIDLEKIANAKATFTEVFDMRKFHYVHENAECVKLR